MSDEPELETTDDSVAAGEQPVSDAEIGFDADETTAADNPQEEAASGGPAPEASPTPDPVAFNLREFAASNGLPGLKDASSDEDAARQLVAYLQNTQRVQQQREYQLHQYHQQLQQLQAQREAVQSPAAQAPAKSKWEAPEYDPAWLNLVRKDAEGNLVAVPGAQPDLPQKLQAYAEWQRQQEQKFYQNPGEFILPQIQDQVRDLIRSEIEGGLAQRQSEAFVRNVVAQNADWIYAKDPAGNTAIDPTTGSPLMTAEGQRYFQYAQQAVQLGIGDPVQQDAYARRQLRADLIELQQQTSATQQTATTANDALKRQALQAGATRTPNRGGSVPRPSSPRQTPQNGKLSFAERMRRDFISNGLMTADSDE